jgi:hypothetical protein|tara:strand:+ start:486 stop:590 length:105 start_codon:yes stop_codon:yes gene_type:complete
MKPELIGLIMLGIVIIGIGVITLIFANFYIEAKV